MKAALYCRVSSPDQNLDNQRARLKEYANERGWTFDIYSETGSTKGTRPVKAQLLAKLRKNEYEAVLVFKLDRWARSLTELVLETKELIDKEIRFISVTESLDFGSAAGVLQIQILSCFAEFERSIISERTKAGIARARKAGKYSGRPPGARDKKRRKRSGYLLKEAKKRQKKDEESGVFKGIEEYC